MIGQAQNKFDADGNLTDEGTRDFIRKLIEALVAWTERLRGSGEA
jgi:chromate reductase